MKKKLKRLKMKIKKLKSKVERLKSKVSPATHNPAILSHPLTGPGHHLSRDAERFSVDDFWPDFRGPNGA